MPGPLIRLPSKSLVTPSWPSRTSFWSSHSRKLGAFQASLAWWASQTKTTNPYFSRASEMCWRTRRKITSPSCRTLKSSGCWSAGTPSGTLLSCPRTQWTQVSPCTRQTAAKSCQQSWATFSATCCSRRVSPRLKTQRTKMKKWCKWTNSWTRTPTSDSFSGRSSSKWTSLSNSPPRKKLPNQRDKPYRAGEIIIPLDINIVKKTKIYNDLKCLLQKRKFVWPWKRKSCRYTY